MGDKTGLPLDNYPVRNGSDSDCPAVAMNIGKTNADQKGGEAAGGGYPSNPQAYGASAPMGYVPQDQGHLVYPPVQGFAPPHDLPPPYAAHMAPYSAPPSGYIPPYGYPPPAGGPPQSMHEASAVRPSGQGSELPTSGQPSTSQPPTGHAVVLSQGKGFWKRTITCGCYRRDVIKLVIGSFIIMVLFIKMMLIYRRNKRTIYDSDDDDDD